MKSSFLISIHPLSDFSAAVIAAGVKSPMETIGKVEKDLKRQKVKGKVLFDLLLAHGSKSNRYFVGEFDGEHFSSTRFQNVDSFYRDFSIMSASILKEKADQVDSSLLSRAMQFAIKQGIPL
ncbi:MAG: type II toxin-antitoxin system RnlB family antitoxin [Methylobacter sp.]|jgi:hypothetical protein